MSALVSKAKLNQTGIACQGQNHGHGKQMAAGGSLELLDLEGHMREMEKVYVMKLGRWKLHRDLEGQGGDFI